MYLRFVISQTDEDSSRRQGLFQAIAHLRDASKLPKHEEDSVDELRGWFSKKLRKPESFSRSGRPHAHRKAISWFRDTAREHIARMYELAEILETHGVLVDVIRTARPGYIVYEDEFQVAAEPFSETVT
jgi:hypothetical protein